MILANRIWDDFFVRESGIWTSRSFSSQFRSEIGPRIGEPSVFGDIRFVGSRVVVSQLVMTAR